MRLTKYSEKSILSERLPQGVEQVEYDLNFKDWLEGMTSTSCVAVFARPLGSVVRRQETEETEEKKKKRKKKEGELD